MSPHPFTMSPFFRQLSHTIVLSVMTPTDLELGHPFETPWYLVYGINGTSSPFSQPRKYVVEGSQKNKSR